MDQLCQQLGHNTGTSELTVLPTQKRSSQLEGSMAGQAARAVEIQSSHQSASAKQTVSELSSESAIDLQAVLELSSQSVAALQPTSNSSSQSDTLTQSASSTSVSAIASAKQQLHSSGTDSSLCKVQDNSGSNSNPDTCKHKEEEERWPLRQEAGKLLRLFRFRLQFVLHNMLKVASGGKRR